MSGSLPQSTLSGVASDRTFLDVLGSVDFESFQASTHGEVRPKATKVSAHSPSFTRSKKVKHRRAFKDAEAMKHYPSRKCGGGSTSSVTGKQHSNTLTSDEHRLARSSSTCIPPTAGLPAGVPASKSPIFHLPCLPTIIDNFLQRLAVALPELDGPNDKNLLLKVWFPFMLHSPTVFQIAMLFSAAHFTNCFPDNNNDNNNNLHPETLLYLKQCALAGLVKLVSSGSTSDETIAAVANMASFEALFGSNDGVHNYHIHMQALQRILRLRGGLAKLGLNGFLARLVAFIDAFSAHILNTDVYLDGEMTVRQELFTCSGTARSSGAHRIAVRGS